MDNKLFLITGMYYQKMHSKMDQFQTKFPDIELLKQAFNDGVFFGIVYSNEFIRDSYKGWMYDGFGISLIFGFELNEYKLSFNKKYQDKPIIKYTFNKKGKFWTGKFIGDFCGEGKCKCMVIPFPSELLIP